MTPGNDNPLNKSKNAILEAAKDKTSLPEARHSKALLFQISVGMMIVAFAVLTFLVITVSQFSIYIPGLTIDQQPHIFPSDDIFKLGGVLTPNLYYHVDYHRAYRFSGLSLGIYCIFYSSSISNIT